MEATIVLIHELIITLSITGNILIAQEIKHFLTKRKKGYEKFMVFLCGPPKFIST